MAPGRSEFSKTVIVGNSGSGKSWLAERLAEGLGTATIDLDSIHWVPGGYNARRDPDLAKSMVRNQASKDCRIIEGVYGWLAHEALPSATAFIWLDLPEAECIENIRGRGASPGSRGLPSGPSDWVSETHQVMHSDHDDHLVALEAPS